MGGQFTDNTHTWGLLWRVGFFWAGDNRGRAGGPSRRRARHRARTATAAPVPQPVVAPTPSMEVPGGDAEVDAGA